MARVWFTIGLALALSAWPGAQLWADPPAEPPPLTAEQTIALALRYSPELAVARRQRGIAEANVVIARTYPFNPVWQSFTMAAGGPETAGITNRVFVENTMRLDLELCGQGKIRQAAAAAAVSRAEWDVATQELLVAVRSLRAFYAFVYRQEKLRLLDATIGLQESVVRDVTALANQGKLKPADVMLANSDLVESRALRGPAQAVVTTAWNDLRRSVGVAIEAAAYAGTLEGGTTTEDADDLTRRALQMRPDLKALDLAIGEAEQRVRLEVANRFGNPSIGPAFEYNETRVTFVGAWLVYALPVLNVRRGEILLRQAERDRVIEDRRRVEVQAGLDVRAALARVQAAERSVGYFAAESLPALQRTMESFEKLFALGEPGVDVVRLIDTRRRLLRARDTYLDALWELTQARLDLAAAVGDLSLALRPVVCLPPAPAPVPALAQLPAPAELPRPVLLPPVGEAPRALLLPPVGAAKQR